MFLDDPNGVVIELNGPASEKLSIATSSRFVAHVLIVSGSLDRLMCANLLAPVFAEIARRPWNPFDNQSVTGQRRSWSVASCIGRLFQSADFVQSPARGSRPLPGRLQAKLSAGRINLAASRSCQSDVRDCDRPRFAYCHIGLNQKNGR